jgi:hypothetical protein
MDENKMTRDVAKPLPGLQVGLGGSRERSGLFEVKEEPKNKAGEL